MLHAERLITEVSPGSPKATKSRLLLALLTAIYAVAFVDRQIINIIAESIKLDLSLTDAQVGLLIGPAFAVSYTVAAIPMARMAERWNRVRLLSGLVAIWSILTALGGVAQSFRVLILARIGVGACEAGCVPAAHSLISDTTSREARGRALAIFSTGLPIGSLVGLALGGFLAHRVGWHGALLAVGLPGLLLSLALAISCRDPRGEVSLSSKQTDRRIEEAELVPSLAATLKKLRQTPCFLWMTAGATILALAGYGHGAFFASFFLRVHASELTALAISLNMGSAIALLGLSLGLAMGITGAVGTALGGIVGDRLAARNFRGYMVVAASATALGAPLTIAALLVPSGVLAISLIAGASLLKSMWYGPLFASIQGLVAPRSRATAVSIFLLIMNGVGLGLGPPLLGGLSDQLSGGTSPAEGLRFAMLSFATLVVISALCFGVAARCMPKKPIS